MIESQAKTRLHGLSEALPPLHKKTGLISRFFVLLSLMVP
jgi:hypothetical protein